MRAVARSIPFKIPIFKSQKTEQAIGTMQKQRQWNQFRSDRGLEMYQNGDGYDCVIEVQENDGKTKTEFNVHKFVLATNSDVLYAMLISDKDTNKCRIQIKDSTGTAVGQMIHYMYTGRLPSNYDIEKDAAPLMIIAYEYQIKPLIEFTAHKLVTPKETLAAKSNSIFLSSEMPFDPFDNLYQEIKDRKDEHLISLWSQCNLNRSLEMLKNGEQFDCVIEVQTEKNDDDDDGDGDGDDVSDLGDQGPTRKYSKIEQEEFNVHKFVLMSNSDVFRAMFSHENTKEFREGRVQIKDSTGLAVGQMIHYMYTGKLLEDDYDFVRDAFPLMAMAHKYQFKPLVDFNAQILSENLTLKNVFICLKLADFYQLNELKSLCGQMIWRNLKELRREPEWIKLKKTSPELAFYVVEEFL